MSAVTTKLRVTFQRLSQKPISRILLLGLIGLAAIILVASLGPVLLVPADTTKDPAVLFKLRNDVRTTLLQALAGALFLTTAYYTWQQVKAARRQTEIAIETLRLSEQGQITERFTRSIDQLGNAEQNIRVGGIFSLERVASDSPENIGVVGATLAAFVTNRAPLRAADAEESEGRLSQAASRSSDVQAAMTVLKRLRKEPDEDLEPGSMQYDLAHADFQAVDLAHGVLQGADFHECNLTRANLLDCVLTGSNFNEAILRQARLSTADLTGAYFLGSDLRGCVAEEANFGWCKLSGAQLQGAHLRWAKFIDTFFAEIFLDYEWHDPRVENIEIDLQQAANVFEEAQVMRRETIQHLRLQSLNPGFTGSSYALGSRVPAANLK
jgi:uncharacterized protein YjbI with pentapeptide repeats